MTNKIVDFFGKILIISENRGFFCKWFEILDLWKRRNKAIQRK